MNILLMAMGLDIGGAETHVVSLAKELKLQGHKPVVVSSGGIYVKELEEVGISHYNAPLHLKDIRNIRKSLKIAKRAIKKEKIDLIHSHGRIPALIGRIVSIFYRIPFMTTAHAKFVHTGIYRYISFWGKEVICISEDVKNHLIENFGVDEKKITIITNGIDIDKFTPKEASSSLKRELGLSGSSKKIVYISRIEGPLSEVAKTVIDVGRELNEENKDIEILIVGDGDDFDIIKDSAEKANVSSSRKFIYTLGKRTDIADIMSLGDVVICVARTALEAMACEKPVILAGGEGYMGLLNEKNLDIAVSNNFTGRTVGSDMTKGTLKQDVLRVLFDFKDSERDALGKLGRKTVKDKFSIKSMTKDTEKVYSRLSRRRKRI